MVGFSAALCVLLALAALLRFGADIGRWCAAQLLALAIRRLAAGAHRARDRRR